MSRDGAAELRARLRPFILAPSCPPEVAARLMVMDRYLAFQALVPRMLKLAAELAVSEAPASGLRAELVTLWAEARAAGDALVSP